MLQGNDDGLLPALTLKETQQILSKLLERVKILSVRYARASQGIQKQVAEQGQQMSEIDINRHFILPHFETGFQEAEDEVLAVSLYQLYLLFFNTWFNEYCDCDVLMSRNLTATLMNLKKREDITRIKKTMPW